MTSLSMKRCLKNWEREQRIAFETKNSFSPQIIFKSLILLTLNVFRQRRAISRRRSPFSSKSVKRIPTLSLFIGNKDIFLGNKLLKSLNERHTTHTSREDNDLSRFSWFESKAKVSKLPKSFGVLAEINFNPKQSHNWKFFIRVSMTTPHRLSLTLNSWLWVGFWKL